MNIKEDLLRRLSMQPNTTFDIMLNHRYLTYDKRVIRVKYMRESGKGHLMWGVYKSIERSPVFVPTPELEDIIVSRVKHRNIFGIDFSQDYDDVYQIDIDPSLNTISIKTELYNDVLKVIKNPGKSLRLRKTNRLLTSEELGLITLNFLEYSFESYLDVCSRKLIGKISKSQQLSFYNTLNAYIPIFIEHTLIFNPFTENPDISKVIKETDIYQLSSKCLKSSGNVSVRLLTHKQICEALHLDKYVRFPFEFLTKMLMGYFSNSYPNVNTKMYVRLQMDESFPLILTEREFNTYSKIDQRMYGQYDSLFVSCMRYSTKMGTKNPLDAYNLVKDARL